jgi:hypothetical protein
MNQRLLTAGLVAAAAIGLSACVVAPAYEPAYAPAYHPAPRAWAPYPPPAARVEIVPAPRRGYVWIPGAWRWDSNRYHWSDGRWERHRERERWVPHHWKNDGDNRWRSDGGYWRRN